MGLILQKFNYASKDALKIIDEGLCMSLKITESPLKTAEVSSPG